MRYIPSIKLVLACAAFVFTISGVVAYGAAPAASLRDKDVGKAEKIIVKLHRLEESVASPIDFHTYKTDINGLYPGLFVDASELRDGDLKTDLTTAVFLYESAYRAWAAPDASTLRCEYYLREAYLRLCRESRNGPPTQFLWSKARLHTEWAEAVLRFQRGDADPETLKELSEMRAERKFDLILAERAVAALRKLAERVNSFSSVVEAEKGRAGASLSSKELSEEISVALLTVNSVLASLPRSPLYFMLRNALDSYRDGLFWWGKISQRREMTVSINSLVATDPLKVIGLDAGTVSRTTLDNWREALRYTERAEKAISALKLEP
jgi:hypothetical protein